MIDKILPGPSATPDYGFNIRHPELRPGEVFLGNFAPDQVQYVGWKTKRVGVQSYNFIGAAYDDARPVFVQQAELPGALVLELQGRGVQ